MVPMLAAHSVCLWACNWVVWMAAMTVAPWAVTRAVVKAERWVDCSVAEMAAATVGNLADWSVLLESPWVSLWGLQWELLKVPATGLASQSAQWWAQRKDMRWFHNHFQR